MDVESVLRLTTAAPYTEARIYQLGAVRFGGDTDWAAAQPVLDIICRLSDDTWVLRDPRVRDRHDRDGQPIGDALTALAAFCTDADVFVAYKDGDAVRVDGGSAAGQRERSSHRQG